MFVIGVIAACLAAVAYGMSTVLRVGRRPSRGAAGSAKRATRVGQTPTPGRLLDPVDDVDVRRPSFILGTMMVVIGFAGGASPPATCRCSRPRP